MRFSAASHGELTSTRDVEFCIRGIGQGWGVVGVQSRGDIIATAVSNRLLMRPVGKVRGQVE